MLGRGRGAGNGRPGPNAALFLRIIAVYCGLLRLIAALENVGPGRVESGLKGGQGISRATRMMTRIMSRILTRIMALILTRILARIRRDGRAGPSGGRRCPAGTGTPSRGGGGTAPSVAAAPQ